MQLKNDSTIVQDVSMSGMQIIFDVLECVCMLDTLKQLPVHIGRTCDMSVNLYKCIMSVNLYKCHDVQA